MLVGPIEEGCDIAAPPGRCRPAVLDEQAKIAAGNTARVYHFDETRLSVHT